MDIDTRYMRRALTLARHGELDASPNPMVGAVIVDPSGMIIGEGWHRRWGEGHAEVNAVASVADKTQLRDATMYVTLEPCAHYGKTPPCAKLIIDCGIPRVVVGSPDPFAKVAGRGIAMLCEAGVEVVVGVLEEECKAMNEKFMTAHTHRRPFITLKWAESAGGFIDAAVSTPLTSVAVHKLRALHDAILVGSGTWLADNPSLTTRLFAGRSPKRIVLDRRGRVNAPEDVIVISDDAPLEAVMERLYTEHGITSLLVEGGAEVLQSFLDAGLYDRIRIERSDIPGGGCVKAPVLPRGIKVDKTETIDNHAIIYLS